jgi:crossover junction endodeoxyribonuclease RusA
MTTPLRITVHGRPAPQGSKRHVGRGILIESSKGLQPWRQAVTTAAHSTRQRHEHPGYPEGPLTVTLTFLVPKPQVTTSARRRFPLLPWLRPDLDKLLRATFDALTDAGIWHDDAQVTTLHARKIYAQPGQPIGARITIQNADVDETRRSTRPPPSQPPVIT